MRSATKTPPALAPASVKGLWTGRVISGLVILFLLFDSMMKLAKATPAVEGTVRLGYPEGTLVGMGIALLASVVLYAIPFTSVLGAILVTGYLGGAVATQVRVGAPLFSIVLFPTYVGVLAWGGLYLRDRRLRDLLPLRASEKERL